MFVRKKMGGEEFSHKYREQLHRELEDSFIQYKVLNVMTSSKLGRYGGYKTLYAYTAGPVLQRWLGLRRMKFKL